MTCFEDLNLKIQLIMASLILMGNLKFMLSKTIHNLGAVKFFGGNSRFQGAARNKTG